MAGWRKSSLSTHDGQCVEVLNGVEQVLVRHSRYAEDGFLAFTHAEWGAFVGGVKLGEFDVDQDPDQAK